jgi:ADP-ribosylglycohydrolase
MKPETKYRGSIKMSAIGDALGWITEFEKSRQSLEQKFGTNVIEHFYPWKKNVGGRFYGFIDSIEEGSYSDDTQLLLAVARSIKKDGRLDHNYFAKIELPNWLDYARGGGRTVKTAADKVSRKSVKWFNNFFHFKVNGETFDYKQSGANGAAMRVLPIALANIGDIETIKEEIFCNSIITHGHPRAILGAMLYGYAVNQIIAFHPDHFSWETYLTQIGIDFPKRFELSFLNKSELKEWLKEWNKTGGKTFELVYEETVKETQNQLRVIYQSIKQETSVHETLAKIGCFAAETKGSGIATVIAGIYLAAKFNDKPIEAIIESVNALGSDTDSIAAFTGGLVGALHGHGIIPGKWKSVQDADYLDEIADRLLAISEDRLEERPNQPKGNLKPLNNPKKDDFNLDERIEFVPLGSGKITSIGKQPTLTKGKYNLVVQAQLDIGQTIVVSKLFDDQTFIESSTADGDVDNLIQLATSKLTPKTLEILRAFLVKQKKTPKALLELIAAIIKNET